MLIYSTYGPDDEGIYHVGYRLAFARGLFASVSTATTEQGAEDECARRNEAQVVGRREDLVRAPNMISNDLREERIAP